MYIYALSKKSELHYIKVKMALIASMIRRKIQVTWNIFVSKLHIIKYNEMYSFHYCKIKWKDGSKINNLIKGIFWVQFTIDVYFSLNFLEIVRLDCTWCRLYKQQYV